MVAHNCIIVFQGKVKLLPASRSLRRTREGGWGGWPAPGCRSHNNKLDREEHPQKSIPRPEQGGPTPLCSAGPSGLPGDNPMEETYSQTLPYPFFQISSLFVSTSQCWFCPWEMSSVNAGNDQHRDVQTVTTTTKAQPCSASPCESHITNKG